MDTRILYVIALMIVTGSGWYYWQSGQSPDQTVELTKGLTYSARGIQLLQTDDTGQVISRTSAASLKHFATQDLTELDDIQSTWYQNQQSTVTLQAEQAQLTEQNQKITLTGHVLVEQINHKTQHKTQLQTTQLVGYPKTQRIEVNQPIQMTNQQGVIRSQQLSADLQDGIYQLSRIRIEYAPAVSQ